MSASSLTLSRRSACDRCRAFKLKCQRDQGSTQRCERCSKNDLDCTTTTSKPPLSKSRTSSRAFGASKQNSSNHVQPTKEKLLAAKPLVLHSNSNTGPAFDTSNVDLPTLRALPSSEQPWQPLRLESTISNTPSFPSVSVPWTNPECILSPYDIDVLIEQQGPSSMYSMDQSDPMDFDSLTEETQSVLQNSKLEYMDSGLNRHSNGNDECASASKTASSSAAALPITLPRQRKYLLELSLELAMDQEKLSYSGKPPFGHNPLKCSTEIQHHPVNRLLSHTARFLDILKSLSTKAGQMEQDPNTVSSPDQNKLVLDKTFTTTVLTTYVSLLASCQEVFTRIRDGFQLAATDASVSFADASLPALQFGQLTIKDNLSMQMNVLIELMSSMLQRIASVLEVSSPILTASATPPASALKLTYWSDSKKRSLKEILVSEDTWKISELMTEIKAILRDKAQ